MSHRFDTDASAIMEIVDEIEVKLGLHNSLQALPKRLENISIAIDYLINDAIVSEDEDEDILVLTESEDESEDESGESDDDV